MSKYTCHSSRFGTASRKSGYHTAQYSKDGVPCERFNRLILTNWQDIPCGHITRGTDEECVGCANCE